MAKSTKIEHAKHNEEVCNYLCPKTDYADWVITTAFYSAIHYVDHKLFPMKINHDAGSKFTIKTLDEYRNVFSNQIADKHSLRAKLVRERCAAISASFEWLRSACSTARYINYIYAKPDDMLNAAKAHLAVISAHCQ